MPFSPTLRALLLAAVLARTAHAQNTPAPAAAPDPGITTLKLSTRLVGISALVRDKHGQPVHGLTRGDFTVKEDGRDQELRNFSEGSELPLTLALMVDTSGSQSTFIADETAASKLFFPQMLKDPEDRAVLVQFDNNVLQLQRMTHSVEALEQGLVHLAEPHDAAPGRGSPGGGGTLLYDAIYVTARAVVGKELGRRAMVILTDGGDNGSRVSIEEAVAAALKADIAIYSVFYADDRGGYRQQNGLTVLEAMSKATGGEVYTVSHSLTLTQIYSRIAETLKLQYTLAYRPPESEPGTYHKLEVRTRDPKLRVQARMGYYTAARPRTPAVNPAPATHPAPAPDASKPTGAPQPNL